MSKKRISEFKNIEIHENLKDTSEFKSSMIIRVSAVKKVFENIDFRYSVFDDCYFRNCKFINCDFTGAQFKNSSYRGSDFIGCKFDYCRFNSVKITNSLLDNSQPGFENVALEFAQTLRVNFSQIGDTEGVNKAIKCELTATKIHLKKAAFSAESWYRDKYQGWERAKYLRKYFTFKLFDFVWGNGESLFKIFCSMIFVILLSSSILVFQGEVICKAFENSLVAFWGIETKTLPLTFAIPIVASRFILLGMFISVLVKRLSRR